jgi:hypothetical protein
MISTLALLASLATPVLADGGNHNGNGNTGILNGNLNGALSGNNLASRSASRSSARNSATQSYYGYNGIDGSGNTSNANNTTFRDRLQAPGIAAPGLTSGANTCAGSWGVGLSGPGAGLSFGNTYSMRECEARTVADQLYRYGLRRGAIQLLINEHPMVNRALTMTGNARPIRRN